MKKTTYWGVLAGLCCLMAVHPVSASESTLEGKDWFNEGKLQIDLNEEKRTKSTSQQVLTILEQQNITLFTPQADARVSANKDLEDKQQEQKQNDIFVVHAGAMNQTINQSREQLFQGPIQMNRVTNYQQRQETDQEMSQSNLFLSRLLLAVAGVVLLVSLWLTWRSRNKKAWKAGISHGRYSS